MGMYDLITKKKQGEVLSKEEINFIVEGFTNGDIPDYQMSAFLMAVCLKGMNLQETVDLTMAMVQLPHPIFCLMVTQHLHLTVQLAHPTVFMSAVVQSIIVMAQLFLMMVPHFAITNLQPVVVQ